MPSTLKKKVQDWTICLMYHFSCLHSQEHSYKTFRHEYRLCEEIGRGGFGVVYRGYRVSDGLPVAIKYIRHRHVREWTMLEKQIIPTEICHLEDCQDVEGVVRLVDWFASPRGFLLVMGRPENCMDLFDVISAYGRLDECTAHSIFVQVVDAVIKLKSEHSLMHRDIKDENIIVDMETGRIWLVDFGAAEFLERARHQQFQGTKSYCPPEWFKRHKYLPVEATVWSLGILLYIMLTGNSPFRNEVQICLGRLRFPDFISEECRTLIKKCLNPTPESRISLEDLRAHPWMQQPLETYGGSRQFQTILRKRSIKRRQRSSGNWNKLKSRNAKNRNQLDVPPNRLTDSEVYTKTDTESEAECSYRQQLSNGEAPRAITVPLHVLKAAASASPNRIADSDEIATSSQGNHCCRDKAVNHNHRSPESLDDCSIITATTTESGFETAFEHQREPLVIPFSDVLTSSFYDNNTNTQTESSTEKEVGVGPYSDILLDFIDDYTLEENLEMFSSAYSTFNPRMKPMNEHKEMEIPIPVEMYSRIPPQKPIRTFVTVLPPPDPGEHLAKTLPDLVRRLSMTSVSSSYYSLTDSFYGVELPTKFQATLPECSEWSASSSDSSLSGLLCENDSEVDDGDVDDSSDEDTTELVSPAMTVIENGGEDDDERTICSSINNRVITVPVETVVGVMSQKVKKKENQELTRIMRFAKGMVAKMVSDFEQRQEPAYPRPNTAKANVMGPNVLRPIVIGSTFQQNPNVPRPNIIRPNAIRPNVIRPVVTGPKSNGQNALTSKTSVPMTRLAKRKSRSARSLHRFGTALNDQQCPISPSSSTSSNDSCFSNEPRNKNNRWPESNKRRFASNPALYSKIITPIEPNASCWMKDRGTEKPISGKRYRRRHRPRRNSGNMVKLMMDDGAEPESGDRLKNVANGPVLQMGPTDLLFSPWPIKRRVSPVKRRISPIKRRNDH